jgi:HEAT repeat protein
MGFMPRVASLLLPLLVVLAVPLSAEDFDIKARPEAKPAKPKEPTTAEIQDLVKRLSANVVNDKTPWEQSKQPQTFVAEARENHELFKRLLIPPGYPNAVSRADGPLRIRAAIVLGLTSDYRAIQPLVNSSVYDPDEKVRAAAVDALVAMNEPAAMRKLVDLAIAPNYTKYPWAVRRSASLALKRYNSKQTIERLLHQLSYELAGGNPLDPKNKPRGVAKGLGTDNPMMLYDDTPTVKLDDTNAYPVLSALKEITGASFDHGEKDMKTWLEWWKKEEPKFK